MGGSLITFKDYLKDALGGSEVKKIVSELSSDALGSLSKAAEDAPSKFSSFGIGIGLAFLGQYILTKKRGSPAARAIAKILGADVNASNRDFALAKLKEPGYLQTIRENILDVLKTKSIDDFAETLGLSSGEAWQVYRQIKDMIVDSEIVGMLSEVSSSQATRSSNIQSLKTSIEKQMNTVAQEMKDFFEEDQRRTIEKIAQLESTFIDEQTRQNLLQSNLKLVTSLTPFRREGSRKCWERGYFFDEDVRSGYDARRPIITDNVIESIENYDGTILFGDAYYGKSVILKRVMFEEIERGYVVVFGDNIEANANQLVELLSRISKDYPKILFIADNVHRTAGEAIFAAFNRIEPGKIRFLFAARENELDRNNKPEIDRAFENIPPRPSIELALISMMHFFL